jgi:thiol:disulfide interchange protein DsbA
MKLEDSTKGFFPKLSTSILVVSIFILVACNETTATAEQVPTEAQRTVQTDVVTAKVKDDANQKEQKIVLADATSATQPKVKPVAPAVPVFVEGKHYFEIFPQINTDVVKGKVEVVELMWLGCPHCYHLEADVETYIKNKADYVDFKQIPAMLNPVWSKDAETFYIAKLLDPTGEKKLINKIFHAIHEQGRRLKNEDSVKRYFAQLGVTEAEYNNTKQSMAYKAILNRARQIGAGSQISSVPSFIINGKYRTSPYTAGSEERLFQLINMLTEKEKK